MRTQSLPKLSAALKASPQPKVELPKVELPKSTPPKPQMASRVSKPQDVFQLGPKAQGPGSGEKIGWLTKQSAGDDQTARFEQVYAQAAAGKPVMPADAKDNLYVTVQGLFGKHYPGYMDENAKALKSEGLQVMKAPIDTDVGAEANAKTLRDFVIAQSEASGKKVVLIGHSMGGVDITEALSLYPELKDHVRAVVTLQTPYAGTPIASDMFNDPKVKPMIEGIFKNVLHGDPRAMGDLSYESRQAFLAAHPYPAGIPTVSIGSSTEAPLSMVGAGRDYMKNRYGAASDGMVAEADSYIPGAAWVRLTGMDHSAGGMADPFHAQSHQAGAMTAAAVAIALGR
jgi:pimeloyl-ACP methyl ester carboxylesterase